MRSLLVATIAAATVASCAPDDKGRAAVASDAGPAAKEPPRSPPATVILRGRRDGDRAVVDVVARGAAGRVHGAAFRLRWDPAKLTFVEARASDAWSSSAIRLAKEGLPGELVVAWAEKGASVGVDATEETILGTLELAATTREGASLELRRERSTLRDPNGAPIAVEWRGGEISAR